MKEHLLDIVGDSFFSILSSKNKRIYIDCILLIYDELDSPDIAFSGDKDLLIHKLTNYFENNLELSEEDDDPTEEIRTPKQKAYYTLNHFKKCNWIGEEEQGDYKVRVNFFDYAIKQIEAIKNMLTHTNDEYTGEIFSVFNDLSHMEDAISNNEQIGILEQAALKTESMMKKLKSLNANIYRYYMDVLKNYAKSELKELTEKILVEYRTNFFDNAYFNLKTKDSLPRYKFGILKMIRKLNDFETLHSFALEAQRVKKFKEYNDAYAYVQDKIRYIEHSFDSLDVLMESIDKKNEQYINIAVSKIMYLSNQSEDLVGYIERLFNLINKNKLSDEDLIGLIHTTRARNLDENSIYYPRQYVRQPFVDVLDDDTVFDFTDDTNMDIFTKYTRSSIDEYVVAFLKDNPYRMASELNVETYEDITFLCLIFLYSDSPDIHYQVEMTKDYVVTECIKFFDFKIIRL